jgi:hypothetical protein
MYRIRADKVENSVGFAGALSLLASFKPGGRARGKRVREKRGPKAMPSAACDASGKTVSTHAEDSAEQTRYWHWLDVSMTGLWVALLLSVVAYAVIEGEIAMAQLDGLDLVATYSRSP